MPDAVLFSRGKRAVGIFMAQNTPLSAASPLHDAASVGDPVAVVGLLKDGADHNAPSDGAIALHIAAREDHLSVAVALLEAGAWPDGRPSDDEDNSKDPTPLQEASARRAARVAKALLKAGARKDLLATIHDGTDDTTTGLQPVRAALGYAVRNSHLEVVRTLAEAGADVNLFEEDSDEPPLVTAAKQGNADVTLVLLDAGANVNDVGLNGFFALHLAKDARVMELLLDAGADIEQGIAQDQDGHGCDEGAPIGWLCLKTHQRFSPLQNLGHRVEAGAVLSSENEIERATTMVQLLLRRGARIDSKGGCVGHYLNTGARGPPLSAAVYNGTTTICAALIDKGADLDATDWERQDFDAESDVKTRPVHDAARFGAVDILRLLLVAGAGVNRLSNFRQGSECERWGTPLQVACRYSQLGCASFGGERTCGRRRKPPAARKKRRKRRKHPVNKCESCWKGLLVGCGNTPAEVIGLRDLVTNQ